MVSKILSRSSVFLGLADVAFLSQIVHDLCDTLFDAQLIRPNGDFGRLGSLVWRRNASEVLDLACTSLLVQAFGVSLFSLLQRDVNEDLDEGESVIAGLRGSRMQIPGNLPVSSIGRDEGCQGDGR